MPETGLSAMQDAAVEAEAVTESEVEVRQEQELSVRFDDDVERLKMLNSRLRDLEGPTDFVPFESGVLNSIFTSWLAIGLEISSGSISEGYIIEKMRSLMEGLELARKKEEIVPHQGPWPWIDEPSNTLNEDAKKALGIEKD